MDIYIPFGWFYLFNLIFLTTFLLFYGIRQKYPISTWITLIAWMLVFFLAGMKLMSFPVREWGGFLFNDHAEPVYRKFVPGGVLFAAVGLFFIRPILGFRKPAMNGLILALPLAIAVQRIGCFINGCCYGKPTSLPWAVHYHPGTSAYQHYLDAGLVQPGDPLSCGIHPAQLYTIIGALIIFGIMWRFRNSWRSPRSRVLFGLILLLLMRFILEFFRASEGWNWYSGTFAGLNVLQLILAGLQLGLLILLIHNEKNPQIARTEKPYTENLYRNMTALLILIFMVWNSSRIFEFQELILIGVLMVTAMVINCIRFYLKNALAPALRYGTITVLAAAFISMGQDVVRTEADSVSQNPDKFWFNLGLGGSAGEYEEIVRNCSGEVTEKRLIGESAGNLNLAFHYRPHQNHHMEYGLNLWTYSDKYIDYQGFDWFNKGFTPYVRYDLSARGKSWLGLMIGANMIWSTTSNESPLFYAIPDLYLRVGPKEVFFADIGVGNHQMMTGKPDVFQVGLGAGLGRKNPGLNTIRLGLSMGPYDLWDPEDYLRLYLTGDFRVTKNLAIKPGIYLGNKYFGSLGLSYDFGRQW